MVEVLRLMALKTGRVAVAVTEAGPEVPTTIAFWACELKEAVG